MFKRFSANYMAMLLLFDGLLIQLLLWGSVQLRLILPIGGELRPEWIPQWVYIPTVGLHVQVAVIWAASFLMLSVYSPRRILHWYDEFQSVFVAHTFATLSLAGALYMAQIELARLAFAYFFVLVLISLLGYRVVLRWWHRLRRQHPNSVARILVVGAGQVGQNVVAEFARQHWPGLEFVGYLDDDPEKQGSEIEGLRVLGSINQAVAVVDRYHIDEVLIALPARDHHRLANLVALLHEMPVRVRVVPDCFELAYFGATVENLGGIPLVGLRDPAIDDFQRLVKRLMDIVLSALGLLFLWPVMLITAVAIKLDDGGPVFYKAARVGENGQPFEMLKFRSMVVNADHIQPDDHRGEEQSRFLHKTPDDPRITRVGRFIRRTSIDELPQLINVFTGEMSLVGPRPELPWMVAKYEPWQRKRFAVPQGMTGWWQVNGRSEKPMHLNTDHDFYYIQNYSLWLDLLILWKTIFVVLRGRGAY